MRFEDGPNKWKSKMLLREYLKWVVDNKMQTTEMEKAYYHLKRDNFMTWLSIPAGLFFGAAVLNPIYVGRSSRLLRKFVPCVSSLVFYHFFLHNYNSWKYIYYLKFWDYYPPHVKEYLKSKDHRHLLLTDIDSVPYKLFDELTKKSFY